MLHVRPQALAVVEAALDPFRLVSAEFACGLRHSNVAITKKHYAEHDMGVLKKVVDNVRAIK
jgi:hypothetical protein